ncbi:cbb3-type cytochrome oxidase assembly protein CcoS [Mesorhizobium sp. ZMM04-5]|uniref:Cbb3-type cytochrome oxidase assembly protein CcoS n=1 Tax=Mesorhizobium marinum TaxID=3228790 RepID=A0ABV3R1D2_9HYPH
MSYLAWLVPIALGMGLAGLAAFLWSMRNGQYDDLDGAAERVLLQDGMDAPLREDKFDGGAGESRNGRASATSDSRRKP